METALDCIGLQLPVCVVLDGSRYYKYKPKTLSFVFLGRWQEA